MASPAPREPDEELVSAGSEPGTVGALWSGLAGSGAGGPSPH